MTTNDTPDLAAKQKPKRPIADLIAGDNFRKTLLPRADNKHNLLWHGWAIMDAFLAGLDHERAQRPALQVSDVIVKAASEAVMVGWQAMIKDLRMSAGDAARAFVSPTNFRLIRAALTAALSAAPDSAGDMAAFDASDAACHKYPSANQAVLRAAYCAGAADQATARPESAGSDAEADYPLMERWKARVVKLRASVTTPDSAGSEGHKCPNCGTVTVPIPNLAEYLGVATTAPVDEAGMVKDFALLEDYLANLDGKDVVVWQSGHETCIDDGTIDVVEPMAALDRLRSAMRRIANRTEGK